MNQRERRDVAGIRGVVEVVLSRDGAVIYRDVIANLVTEVGDEYYGERAAGIASPPDQVTGMRLGTGTTPAAKTGAGASIGAYIAGSSIAIEAGFPTSALSTGARRISWQSVWAAGVATNPAITEAVITNETPLTDVIGAAANTISRVVFAAVNKTASDTLTITWAHDLAGSV